jgi:hypothetical protein
MNRRKFFGMLSAAGMAAMVPIKSLAAKPSPVLLTKEQWMRETFGDLDKQDNPYPLIVDFVASRPGIHLFKNRSGQWIYQTYDPESGNPIANEMIYLVSGKPNWEDPGMGLMPRHLKVNVWGGGCAIAGIAIGDTGKLKSDLEQAHGLLVKALRD